MPLPTFIESVFPVDISYGSSGGPKFSTIITATDSGAERRQSNWSQPLRMYELSTGIQALETNDQAAALSALVGFFNSVYGRAIGFRWKDWSDYTTAPDLTSPPSATDQVLGTGDGTVSTFQLLRTYNAGDYQTTRQIRKPVAGTVLVSVDGTATANGWTCDTTTGVVTFAVAPAVNAVVRAGCEYHVPVRFDDDALSVRLEDYAQGSAQLPVKEIRV